MKKIRTIRLGDLIAALYDEAEKETKIEKFQSGIVALALFDLRKRILTSTHTDARKHQKVA